MPASVLILTLNEEKNLPRCLESVAWCDDIVILDSFSTDRTIKIAEAAKARVVRRRFENYASQRNYGLEKIEFKNSWVLMLDADECCTDELYKEIIDKTELNHSDACLYCFRRKDMFMGRWIRRSSGYPTWFGRLIKLGCVHVRRDVNEEYHADGKVNYLQGHLIHFPFNKGFSAWLEKHNRYSTIEADLIENHSDKRLSIWNIFQKDPLVRRKALKSIIYRLPGRPLIIFFALYILRGGILEGKAGFIYCVLKAFYEFMISCKVAEKHLRQNSQPL